MEFSITTDVDASADVVFAVLTDVERWSEWTPTVTRVERLDAFSQPLALNYQVMLLTYCRALPAATRSRKALQRPS